MARTKQVAMKRPQGATIPQSAEDSEISVKTEKSEIVKAPSSDAKKRARKMMSPQKMARNCTDLSAKPFIFYRRPFSNLVREIAQDYETEEAFPNGIRFDKKALDVLQLAAESYLHCLFEDTAMVAENSKRPTILHNDMRVVLGIYDRQKARPKTTLERELTELNEKRKARNHKKQIKAEKLSDDAEVKTETAEGSSEAAPIENGKTEKKKPKVPKVKKEKAVEAKETTLEDDEPIKPKKKYQRVQKTAETDSATAEEASEPIAKKKLPVPQVIMLKKEKGVKKMNSFATSSAEVDPSEL